MHPSATTAMVLGIVSLAWFIGGRTLRQIDAHPIRFSGRERADTGGIMCMMGTALRR